MFQLRTSIRLKNSPYFCVLKPAVKQMVWNEAENRERDWGETLTDFQKKNPAVLQSIHRSMVELYWHLHENFPIFLSDDRNYAKYGLQYAFLMLQLKQINNNNN